MLVFIEMEFIGISFRLKSSMDLFKYGKGKKGLLAWTFAKK